MSLLSAVEEAIKACKAEQADINDSIQLYRGLLQSLTPEPKTTSEESECAVDAAADTDTSPGEREDIELLERALEKALRVRAGTAPSKKESHRTKASAPQKEAGTTNGTSKEGMQACVALKGNHSTTKSTSKSASLDRKEHRKACASVSSMSGSKSSPSYNPRQSKSAVNKNRTQGCAGIVHHQVIRKSGKLAVAGSFDPSQSHTATHLCKNKTMRSDAPSGKAAATRTPSSNNTVPVSHTEEFGAQSSPPQNGIGPEWRSLASKKNRLWDKVVALQRKPVPGRSHFMERMRAMFPGNLSCGSPDQTRALVHRLTHQGHDLRQRCRTKEILDNQSPEVAAEPDDKESNLTLERLQVTVAELRNFADQVKQEWEAWDRWRPAGGCLCPTGANGLWGDGMIAALPLTITYTTEAEIRELEKLRTRVALLQQEIYLEQALLDALSPQLSSIIPGPGCPNVSMLRGVYSLLGEGGERFPAIVLDSEPD